MSLLAVGKQMILYSVQYADTSEQMMEEAVTSKPVAR